MQLNASCRTLVPPGKAFSVVSDSHLNTNMPSSSEREEKNTTTTSVSVYLLPINQNTDNICSTYVCKTKAAQTPYNDQKIAVGSPFPPNSTQPKTLRFPTYKDAHADTNTSNTGTLKNTWKHTSTNYRREVRHGQTSPVSTSSPARC